MYFDIFH